MPCQVGWDGMMRIPGPRDVVRGGAPTKVGMPASWTSRADPSYRAKARSWLVAVGGLVGQVVTEQPSHEQRQLGPVTPLEVVGRQDQLQSGLTSHLGRAHATPEAVKPALS